MKKIVAVYLSSESGDDYILCLEGTVKSIVKQILNEFGDEANYIHFREAQTLDKNGQFVRDLALALHESKLGSLDEE